MAERTRRCEVCARKIKDKDNFCKKDGGRAVMFPRRRAAPLASKAAGSGYQAPVYDLEQIRYQQLMAAFKAAGGNAALRDGYSAMITKFATRGGDAA
jgi:hypothetical protein